MVVHTVLRVMIHSCEKGQILILHQSKTPQVIIKIMSQLCRGFAFVQQIGENCSSSYFCEYLSAF